MGCVNSKDEAEEVLLCKARKRHIKQASSHRHAFASSHAYYISSLKNTGAAIRQFAEIEDPSSSMLHEEKASLPSSRAMAMANMSTRGVNTGSGLPHVRAPPEPPEFEKKPLPRARSMPQPDFFHNLVPSSTSKSYGDKNRGEGRNKEDGLDDDDDEDEDDEDEDDEPDDDDDDSESRNENSGFGKHRHHHEGEEENHQYQEEHFRAIGKPFEQPPLSPIPWISSRSLAFVLKDIDDIFLESYKAGHEVSRLYLDAHRDFFHTPVIDERSGIQRHRQQVSRIISWTKSPKEPLADEQNNSENLASTLDKLHAWEKKLCDESKALASTTLELARRAKQLQSQKERGAGTKIDKTNNIVKGLETKLFVELQAITEAKSEICKLRDACLAPQLVNLLEVLKNMWSKTCVAHGKQNLFIQDLINLKPETVLNNQERGNFSERLTRDLKNEIAKLCNNLETMVKSQKEWMESMVEWLRGQNENDVLGSSEVVAPLLELCKSWSGKLKELPSDKVIVELKDFVEILHEMFIKQGYEMEAQKRINELQKDFEKKNQALESYENTLHDKSRQENGVSHENRDPLEERKAIVKLLVKELQVEKERHKKLCEENSVMMLGCLQKGLPKVLDAITTFSKSCMSTYDSLLCDHKKNFTKPA